jgi:hypothetical protein
MSASTAATPCRRPSVSTARIGPDPSHPGFVSPEAAGREARKPHTRAIGLARVCGACVPDFASDGVLKAAVFAARGPLGFGFLTRLNWARGVSVYRTAESDTRCIALMPSFCALSRDALGGESPTLSSKPGRRRPYALMEGRSRETRRALFVDGCGWHAPRWVNQGWELEGSVGRRLTGRDAPIGGGSKR